MRSPSSEEILAMWEAAWAEHPLDRALTIAAAFSDQPKRKLAQLPIGVRDSLLFRARASLFGAQMETYSECPSCGASVEFAVGVDELPLHSCTDSELALAAEARYETVNDVAFRSPNSVDLAAIANIKDPKEAELLLVRRCMKDDDTPLDEIALQAINQQIANRDPAGDLEFALVCPNCGAQWSLALDIASFFWRELNSYVKRLVSEVDMLARAYGWPERDILNLSSARRAIYLQMVNGA